MATSSNLIDWRPEFSVGSTGIDHQHKKLINLINRLHRALRAGMVREQMLDIVEELVSYTRHHFEAEERILRQVNYPGLDAHARKHRELTREVMVYYAEMKGGKVSSAIRFLEFLQTWLTQHILETDKAYAPHVVALLR